MTAASGERHGGDDEHTAQGIRRSRAAAGRGGATGGNRRTTVVDARRGALGFAVNFWAWALLSPLAPRLRDALDLAQRCPAPHDVEQVPAAGAVGQVLARPVRAAVALPGTDVAAMDGYAVAGTAPWRLVGKVFAGGTPWSAPLAPGTAVEIATGAPVPADARAVVPYECCRRDGDLVMGPAGPRTHIRTAGEDVRPGDELVPAGRVVTAAVLGAAAQAGADVLTVYRRPRVCVVVTGDEVVSAGTPLPGQVRDALGPAVTALVCDAGGTVVEHRYLPDTGEALRVALHGASGADVVAVTGSSSVGAADHLHRVLDGIDARWYVDGVRCRPGHPQVLAQTGDGRWVVGLPGNPFAGLVAAVTLLRPLVAALAGRPPAVRHRLPVAGDASPYPHGVRRVAVRVGDGHATVVPGARPASLRAAAQADALVVIEPDWTAGALAELVDLRPAVP
ncbi:molybdopterin molybdotransferase MoeA [Dactylosporangium fulvum]|uniref:molybdopterin molybdotransferase MoeA n=1 Tax=Dactylosporangium fulvum TaxID=53359 RepID=UPI0031E09D18